MLTAVLCILLYISLYIDISSQLIRKTENYNGEKKTKKKKNNEKEQDSGAHNVDKKPSCRTCCICHGKAETISLFYLLTRSGMNPNIT